MSIATTNESAAGDVVSTETALACLFRLGAQNGVYAEIGVVRRRNLIEGDSLPVARLVELAGEFGLCAERVRLAVLEAPRAIEADRTRTVERPARPDHSRPHRLWT